MKMKVLALALAAVMLLFATGCSAQAEAVTDLAKIDNTAWLYNADDDVYYQIGISYCEEERWGRPFSFLWNDGDDPTRSFLPLPDNHIIYITPCQR